MNMEGIQIADELVRGKTEITCDGKKETTRVMELKNEGTASLMKVRKICPKKYQNL
jgi:hypothetical protein